MLLFNPFAFLIEDPYSPGARAFRSSLWGKVVDTFRVWCGSIRHEAIDESVFVGRNTRVVRTVGLFDYATFMVPRLLQDAMMYLQDSLGDPSRNPLVTLPYALIGLIYGLAVAVRVVACLILTGACLLIVALAQVASYFASRELKEEVRKAADSERLDWIDDCEAVHVNFDSLEVSVVFKYEYYTDDKYAHVYMENNESGKRVWQAMRKLNLGQINQLIRFGECHDYYTHFKDDSWIKYQVLCSTAEVLLQAVRTQTSHFQMLPTELILLILRRAHIDELVEKEEQSAQYTHVERRTAEKRLAGYHQFFTKKFQQERERQVSEPAGLSVGRK